MFNLMDWNPKDWTWAPRLDEGLGWLCRTIPGVVRYTLKAPLNIDRWNFRRIWAWLKVSTRSYYFMALIVLAVFATPLWLDLVATVRGNLSELFATGPATDANGETTDLRGHYYAIAILITALAALFTAPLTLLKAYINERQTTAAEQGLITDRITRAVEQLVD